MEMNGEVFRRTIVAHLRENGIEDPDAESALISRNILDSMQVLTLILMVEGCLKREVEEEDLSNANFDSVAAIVALMQRYAAQGVPVSRDCLE